MSIAHLLEMNYRLVMSNSDAWYLDCGYGAWIYDGYGPDNNWCSPFKGNAKYILFTLLNYIKLYCEWFYTYTILNLHISGWKTVYQNSPRKMVENFGLKWPKYKNQILGGEAAMWSEQVDIILAITFKQFLLQLSD